MPSTLDQNVILNKHITVREQLIWQDFYYIEYLYFRQEIVVLPQPVSERLSEYLREMEIRKQ